MSIKSWGSPVHQNGSVDGVDGIRQSATDHKDHQHTGQPPAADQMGSEGIPQVWLHKL
jgi:hypothetical protein